MLLIFIAVILILAGLDDLCGISDPIAMTKAPCHIRRTFRGMLFLLTGIALFTGDRWWCLR